MFKLYQEPNLFDHLLILEHFLRKKISKKFLNHINFFYDGLWEKYDENGEPNYSEDWLTLIIILNRKEKS